MLNPYDCIRRPVMTEKSMLNTGLGAYTFVVDVNATKSDVKCAVESIFSVKVSDVRIYRLLGKKRGFRGRVGKRSDTKRAVVRVKEGTINFESGF